MSFGHKNSSTNQCVGTAISGDQVTRPGISPAWLQQNGIHHISAQHARDAVGAEVGGLLIPYMDPFAGDAAPILDPGDKRFARLRLDVPQGAKKYHQPAGTGVHGYLPAMTDKPPSDSELVLVEGEFKALSLTDPTARLGMSAIGLSGFYGFAQRQAEGEPLRFVPEIERALAQLTPQTVFYFGDNDTCKRRLKSAAGGARKVRHLPGPRELVSLVFVKPMSFVAR